MANFFQDNPEIKFHLSHPLLKRIVELKERNYSDFGKYDYAPENFEDALDSYERVLDLAGDVTANIIAPNAEAVDAEGLMWRTTAWSMRQRLTRILTLQSKPDSTVLQCHAVTEA